MAADMRHDCFAEYTFGKLALQKIGSTDENFRLYKAGWLGKGLERDVMEVTGAVFRESMKGPTEGQLNIKVIGTDKKVRVTAAEMDAYDKGVASPDTTPTV